jgi:XTP/dITP diphosphohydrolase
MTKLLLATGNQAKVREYMMLLQDLPCELVTLAEQGIGAVSEVGGSLEENARLKAVAYAARSQLLALADDSGLEVDALGGEPGPLSARYAGEGASDSERVNYLLSRLKGVPWPERSARFRCVIAVATPEGKVELCSGECPGFITFEPRGSHGFGYDPVFYLPELDKTMAELPMELKNQVSHRGQAARQAKQVLRG